MYSQKQNCQGSAIDPINRLAHIYGRFRGTLTQGCSEHIDQYARFFDEIYQYARK